MEQIEIRLKIYKDALHYFKNCRTYYFSICEYLILNYFEYCNKPRSYNLNIKKIFPELYKFKPHHNYKQGSRYWWKPRSLSPRAKCLEKVIDYTQKLIKNKS
jgi:hypothetical protein